MKTEYKKNFEGILNIKIEGKFKSYNQACHVIGSLKKNLEGMIRLLKISGAEIVLKENTAEVASYG